MTGNNNYTFMVTVHKDRAKLNIFKSTVTYQQNTKKWDNFRSALNSIRGDVNNFLTEEIAKQSQYTIGNSKRECSEEENEDAIKSIKKRRQK